MYFVKMQGAGNDFILLTKDAVQHSGRTPAYLARHLCQLHYSIGADGLMIVEPLEDAGHLRMDFYNADGSIGEMCGNGARCLIQYCLNEGICTEDRRVCLHTDSGTVWGYRADPAAGPWGNTFSHKNSSLYTVIMPDPSLYQESLTLTVAEQPYSCTYMELGIPGLPHLILPRPALPLSELHSLAAQLCHHPHLRNGANVNFYTRIRADTILLLTYERGVEDFTQACGSGASCSAAALQFQGILSPGLVTVQTSQEILYVTCSLNCSLLSAQTTPPIHNICLTGPAKRIAHGELCRDAYL